MSKFLKIAAALVVVSSPAFAAGLDLGRAATAEEIAAWDIDVRPDGQGLPEGSGDVWAGEEVFTERCAVCHGDFGEAVGRWPALAGGHGSLTRERPVKTIGSYWPYLSTVWDYVHRAMPFGNAQSLTDDEVYAITAYLLYLNDLVDEDFTLSHENFAGITLPNEGNFFPDDRAEMELAAFSGEACMTDCKDSVEITMRAAVLDVTPEETKARQLKEAVQAAKDGKAPEAEAPVQVAQAETAVAEVDPAMLEEGEAVFKKCMACHQVGDTAKNRAGPVLNGVVGSPAGGVDGFRYSNALQSAAEDGLVWTDEDLSAFLEKPRSFLKGTKMSFGGLKSEEDRAAVIAYLKSFE
ncbi:MAG: c-type cytochrome [Silicimonas sp.]|nr:c-type cytochrome [Silicimonas sp.]NND42127.1 c-type cytochrome [Silicimonas sp.]